MGCSTPFSSTLNAFSGIPCDLVAILIGHADVQIHFASVDGKRGNLILCPNPGHSGEHQNQKDPFSLIALNPHHFDVNAPAFFDDSDDA